jgi:hypothetical protein
MKEMFLSLGGWATKEDLDRFLQEMAKIDSIPERIERISRQFLGTPYVNGTLIGSPEIEERLVVNLGSVDCFTYIDLVEAMRLSHSFDQFIRYLVAVRYKDGTIAYQKRRHFFTDWIETARVDDITAAIGGASTKEIPKTLNTKSDGSLFLPGIPVVPRLLLVAPARIGPTAMRNLRNGDYVGIFDEMEGLDVSHVGLVVRHGDIPFFRHASSLQGRVVEQNLHEYLSSKPGMIVLRPRD